MARNINEEAVLKQIDHMDSMDSDYSEQEDQDEGGEQEEEGEEETDESDTADGEGEGEEGEEGSEEGSEDAGEGEEPPVRKTGKQEQYQKVGNNAVDKKGNIVDPRTGQMIAKAGTERRLYEKTQRLTTALDESKVRLAQYDKEHNDSSNYFGAVKQAGLSTEEIGEAFNIAIMYKQNPVAAAKEILERVLAMGHNVTDILGADPGNAIEIPAIARLIDERLAPILKPLEQQRVSDEQTKQAEARFDKWVSENEYADQHLDVLDDIMGRNPELSPQKAYNALVLFANKHQLDFTQPLGPQIANRQSVQGNGNTNPRERSTRKPFATGSGRPAQPIGEGAYADSNASWSDIIRTSMNGGARPQR
jgi:hypothetical protein